MKTSSKSISLQELCRFAKAIEKRGNDLFTGLEIAAYHPAPCLGTLRS